MAENTLGRQHISTSECVPVDARIEQIAEVIEALGNPGPAKPGDNVTPPVYFDDATNELVIPNPSDPQNPTVIGDIDDFTGGGGGGGFNKIRGYLDSDLTIDDSSVTVTVTDWTSSDPGATIVADNPEDMLHFDPPKYLYIGNEDGYVEATEFDGGWVLDFSQVPYTRPV